MGFGFILNLQYRIPLHGFVPIQIWASLFL